MTSRVRILDEATILRIAAGEVVERPASVVKELVENALDAAARRIEVRFTGGGIDEIVVRDDGEGIAAEDLPRVVLRHATSKIQGPGDLERITSYGFRGEALAAIAEAADLEILSRTEDDDGYRLERTGSGWSVVPAPLERGTIVRVRRLFGRAPARRKFLSTPRGEGMRIANLMERIALARPDVAWTVVADGEEVLRTAGKGLAEAAEAVFGEKRAREMLEVEAVLPAMRVTGLVVPPEGAEKRRTRLFFAVNGRAVEAPVLVSAVRSAYETLLPPGRHPAGFVAIEIGAEEVDVNCHPTKREVRFRAPNEVFRAVREAVRMRLSGHRRAPDFATDAAPPAPASETAAPWDTVDEASAAASRSIAGASQEAPDLFGATPPVRIAGKVAGRYLVGEDEEGLVIIDLHAAHERVLFERLLDAVEEGRAEAAPFLLPQTIEVSPAAREAALAAADDFARLGFEVEPFGPGGLLLRSIPAALAGRGDPAALVAALAEELAADPDRGAVPPYEWIARRACRRAVRTGDPLGPREADDLVRQLYAARDPLRCPHGRPTILRIPVGELDRRFGRAGL